MENKRKALGKGLEQLFGSENVDLDAFEQNIVDTASNNDEIKQIKLSEIRSNPYQPRTYFNEEALNELAESIKIHGVVEPIIVKKSIKGYELVAGERRTKASRLAGMETIPAVVKDFTDQEMMDIAILENIQREDLTAIEEAEAYAGIIKALNITQEELAKKIGKSRTHVTNMLGILRLPQEIKNDILNGYISMGHARVLSKLEDKEKMIQLCERVKFEHLSVHDLEDIAANPIFERKNKVVKIKQENQYKYVEDIMTDKLGNKVKIKNKKVIIPFNSEKDLERILDILDIEIKID